MNKRSEMAEPPMARIATVEEMVGPAIFVLSQAAPG
jgi:hypothetical protein